MSKVGSFLGQWTRVQVQAHMARSSFVSACLHFVFQVAVVSSSTSHYKQLVFWSTQLNRFRTMVVHVSPPHPTSFFPSTDSFSVDGCLEWRLMAGLRAFASHGSGMLSRGWLDTVEAPGYPSHPASFKQGSRLTCYCIIS